MKNSQNGNASLETIFCFPIVIASVLILFLSFYGLYLQAGIQQQSDEYLLCAEFQNEDLCHHQLQKKLKVFLPLGQWKILAPPPSPTHRQVQIQFLLSIKGVHTWTWSHQSQIKRDLSLFSF